MSCYLTYFIRNKCLFYRQDNVIKMMLNSFHVFGSNYQTRNDDENQWQAHFRFKSDIRIIYFT